MVTLVPVSQRKAGGCVLLNGIPSKKVQLLMDSHSHRVIRVRKRLLVRLLFKLFTSQKPALVFMYQLHLPDPYPYQVISRLV